MESTTSLSSTKKPRWRRGLGTVRRLPSRIFKKPNIRSSSPTPSEREPGSDSISIKGFSKAPSLEVMDTSPPAAAVNGIRSHLASSLNGENSKREAAPLASEPDGHAVLMRREMFTASPENTLELPIITNEIASVRAPPAAAEQPVLTSEPEEMLAGPEPISKPSDEQELAPTHATKPPHGIEEPAGLPLAYIKDTPPEPDDVVSVEDISAPHSEAPIPETAPFAGEPTETSSTEATSFDVPPPQNGISAKTSYESLAAAVVGWGNSDENAGYRQGNTTIPIASEDPFADPQPHDAVPDDTIWASFEIPSDRKIDSDSTSVGDSSKAPSVRLLDGVPPSSAAPAVMDWEMLAASPEHTPELPVVVNEINSIRATPTTAEQLVLSFELEERMTMPEATSPSAIEQELVPTHAANPPLIHIDDMPTELTRSEAAVAMEKISPPHSEATTRETPPSVVKTPIRHPSAENGTIFNFDVPASQTGRSVGTNDNSSQIRGGRSTAPVKRSNGNKGQGQRKSIVPMSSEDPLADQQPHNDTPGVSATDTIRMPEPLHLRSSREGRHRPVMHVPSPPTQDATGQTASQSHSTKNTTRPEKRVRESTNGRSTPLPRGHPDDSNNWPILIGLVVGMVSLLSFVFRGR